MDRIEEKIITLIDENRQAIIDFGNDIYDHAELGYKEFRTTEKFQKFLKTLGISKIQNELAITGAKGYLKEGDYDTTIGLIGELDALRIPQHPHVNPDTQAAHACGHAAQLAGVIGAAVALSDEEVSKALDGNVVFFAVPAEEYGEIEFKNELRRHGKIQYGGGKCELIRIGAFDDIDINVVHHSAYDIEVGHGTSNGFVSKIVRYIGKEAHAAACPERGINALNAASLGLTALGYIRETFRDEDSVRVHPILTQGGNLVNVVPGEAVVEMLVRAKTVEAIRDTDLKVDRAFKAGADALGAGIEITTLPGYLPRIPYPPESVLIEAAKQAAPGKEVILRDESFHGAGSSDVGDLTTISPVLSFTTGGVKGDFHASDFEIIDEEEAYITTAKIFALTAYKLLRDKAQEARRIKESFKPQFTKEEYVEFMNSMDRFEEKEMVPPVIPGDTGPI